MDRKDSTQKAIVNLGLIIGGLFLSLIISWIGVLTL